MSPKKSLPILRLRLNFLTTMAVRGSVVFSTATGCITYQRERSGGDWTWP